MRGISFPSSQQLRYAMKNNISSSYALILIVVKWQDIAVSKGHWIEDRRRWAAASPFEEKDNALERS
jgi:hypothetical protein